MILMPLDRGRFVVVHPCSTFSDCRQLSTSLMPKSKNGKNWSFSPPEGDRINRSRQILTRKRLLWVSCSTPDLALIGNRGSVQEPPKSQHLPKISADRTTTLTCQISSESVHCVGFQWPKTKKAKI